MTLPAQLAALTGTFIVVTAIAGVAGAANLGVALAFGQIAFVIALVMLLLRG